MPPQRQNESLPCHWAAATTKNSITVQFHNDGQGINNKHIEELQSQEIKVDNDNKALPHDPSQERGSTFNLSQDASKTNHKVANGHCQKIERWGYHDRSDMKGYGELELWMMCFPFRELIINVILPE